MKSSKVVIIGWSALCVLVAGHPGCVLSGTVTEERARLGAKLEAVDSRARICAPRELAEARANLEFATYEAGEGQSLRAAEHLAEALRLTGLAEEASKGDECEPDRDLDGIRDSKDKCPTEAEDYDGHADEDGCPDYDRDNDGVEDDVDRCPDIPEDRDGFQDSDGCPDKDNDRDGIVDANDQCPLKPEDRDGFQDTDGCPDTDNDQDGILDSQDRCPNDPEDMDGDQDEDGCPDLYKKIRIVGDRIELKQKIFFHYNRAKIKKKSFDMLNEVADVLRKNSTMRVRIEGHTDARGSDKRNMRLSRKRAEAVRIYLIEAGVSSANLHAKGYGETRLLPNTPKRDERNRRVEFHITDR